MPAAMITSRPWRVAFAPLVAVGLLVATFVGGGVAGGVASATPTPSPRPYSVAGLSVSGATNAVDAPLLKPGRYRDRLDTAAENSSDTDAGKYYRVTLRTGDTPYVTATVVPPARADSGSFTTVSVAIYLRPVDRGNISCSFFETGSATGSDADLNTATAVVSPGRVGGPGWDEDCPTNAEYGVQVLRTGTAYAGTPMPVEIAFRQEPSATATGLPKAARSQPNRQAAAASSKPTPIDSNEADSFDDAPPLATGQYRDSFTTGETRYYRIHLDWGQRLAYTLTVDQDPDVADSDGSSGHTTITNPLREPVVQPDRAQVSESDLGSTGDAMTGSTLVPVRYTNRASEDDNITPYGVDGDYYLAFSTDFPTGDQPTIHVGFTLVIDVFGRTEPGPKYTQGGPLPPGSDTGGSSTVVLGAAVAGGVVVLAIVVILLVARRRRDAVGRSPLPQGRLHT